ncbi:MAG: Hsp20/alpha crystallin family protein [Thermoanaerobaculia bacterium]
MPKPGNPRLPVAFIIGGEGALPGPVSHPLSPPVDVVESPSGWRLVFEIPGAVADRTSIEVKERIVVVRGERRRTEGDGGVFLRLERVTGPFERALELPEDADAERAKAYYQDGLLVLDVPKRASTRGRTIPIRRDDTETK